MAGLSTMATTENKPLRFEGDEWQLKALGFKRFSWKSKDGLGNHYKSVKFTKNVVVDRLDFVVCYNYKSSTSRNYKLTSVDCIMDAALLAGNDIPIEADKVHQLRTLYKLITGKTLSPKLTKK